ncbi:MAG: hypothetical protein ACRDUW_21775 [Pseudonocardiaceae bacterium]
MIRPSPILAAVAVVEDWVQVQRSQDERSGATRRGRGEVRGIRQRWCGA